MRTLKTPPALLSLLIAAVLPAQAQVKTDLGAAAAAGQGSAAAGAANVSAPSLGVPLAVPVGLGSLSAPGLSAPLAAAAPAAAALPASALSPARAAASAPDAPKPPSAAKAAAAASLPPGPPGDSGAAPASPPAGPPVLFVDALRRLGVPAELTGRLMTFLGARHPGDQNEIYHGLGHTREVANTTARVVENAGLPADRKVLLIVAAALHDVDPERVPDTPARVAATVAHLDADPEARALLRDFGGLYSFTPAQVKALILATDFSLDPAEMKAKQEAFASAARDAFPGEDFGLEWGRRLAFLDQSSTYVASVDDARKRVEGLAHEIRSQLAANGKGPGPTDAQMLAGTAKFLAVLRNSPQFAILPADLQDNFDKVWAYFDRRQTPESWAAAAAPAPARAPPDVAAAKRYVAEIAGGLALDERQTDALIGDFFEEQGIEPGSERAEAVRRALVPSRAASDAAAAASLSPALKPYSAVLIRLARDHRTTPAAIQAALERRGVVSTLVGLDAEQFALHAGRVLDRDERERAVARYPRGAQGLFMRAVADAMGAASGKSVEEVARDGVFGYADLGAGDRVVQARAGRDPDVRNCAVVYYITRADGRWKLGVYRQNREVRRADSVLERALKNWLISGGVPEKDLE